MNFSRQPSGAGTPAESWRATPGFVSGSEGFSCLPAPTFDAPLPTPSASTARTASSCKHNKRQSGSPGGSAVRTLPAVRALGSVPGSGRPPRGGHGNPLQYSRLENPLDRGAWRALVHGVVKSTPRDITSQTESLANGLSL